MYKNLRIETSKNSEDLKIQLAKCLRTLEILDNVFSLNHISHENVRSDSFISNFFASRDKKD